MSEHKTNGDSKTYWLDNPRNVDKIVWSLVAICILLFVVDFFYHKHVFFGFEEPDEEGMIEAYRMTA